MYRKKLIFLLFVVLLITTGCTQLTNDIDQVINATMASDKVSANTVSTGYELYMPIGVKQVVDNEYNQKFKINNRYVYLYVDTISYYYKNTLNYKVENNYNYYYKELNLNNKTGYVGINKVEDDLYFCEVVYNYSKSEFYSDFDDLSTMLANVLIIQKSIKYNDNLISTKLNGEANEGREVKYQLDSPKDSKSTFSDFLQEYVPEKTEEVELPDGG